MQKCDLFASFGEGLSSTYPLSMLRLLVGYTASGTGLPMNLFMKYSYVFYHPF